MISKAAEKINVLMIKFWLAINGVVDDEEGDTNFVSILIILGIVIILAGVFIGFKDTIIEKVQGIIDGFEIH